MDDVPKWRSRSVGWTAILRAAIMSVSLLLSSCQPFELLEGFAAGNDDDYVRSPQAQAVGPQNARVCATPTVNDLARELDELERHIERYGSVVAKQPDVWGQARLTKFRDDFEQQMSAELSNFTATLQGSVNGSDQAYFADALALSAAASSTGAFVRKAGAVISNNTSASSQGSSSGGSTPSSSSSNAISPPALPDQSGTFAGFNSISRTAPPTVPPLTFAAAKGGITLEPAVYLDQKARYLNYLDELRRINEGDDTADSPGYSLDLVRLPVSILPGKRTDKGYGAEVTMTITPYLSDDLLPTTFRNLVLNDLVDQISYPATQFINNPANNVYLDERSADDLDDLFTLLEELSTADVSASPAACQQKLERLKALRWKPDLQTLFARPEWAWVDDLLREDGSRFQTDKNFVAQIKDKQSEHMHRLHGIALVPATKSRRARLPFPPTQMLDIYGYDFTYHLAADAYRAFEKEPFVRTGVNTSQIYIHLPDVQGFLQEELTAAYKLLTTPSNIRLWDNCNPALVDAIRAHRNDQIQTMRQAFKCAVQGKEVGGLSPHSTVVALAWAILVESALLNDQLIHDMKESASLKGCAAAADGWQPYYLPAPPDPTRQAFNDYVRCRWPVHVFALDPAAQDQNLASTYSSRREMQLALSLAFVSGRINASNMTRYARRIEFDYATIDLNGTAIGFSHADDTFGWRFYPRFQTPDVPGNMTACLQDLFIGGPNRNSLLKERRLEPGIRECYAVVIMPSFVPYATLNVSSNWFKLTNPKKKELDTKYAMRLSRDVKAIESSGGNVCDAQMYREADVERLHAKFKQLETRLPLQSTQVQIPYENTLGGFAMFNTGVTDLAPELIGWYGTESINPKAATTVFLVGNHFSVHQTAVIAGGQTITSSQMLSRQVIQVTIPSNPITVGDSTQTFVDVHLATPYGVTQHLLIPVSSSSATDPAGGANGSTSTPDPTTTSSPQGVAWKPATFEVAYIYSGLGISPPPNAADPKYRPATVLIQNGDVDTSKYDTVDVTLKFDSKTYTGNPIVIAGVAYDPQQKGYAIGGDKLAALLFTTFGTQFGPEGVKTPVPLTTVSTSMTFKSSKNQAPNLSKTSTNNLTINWIKAPKD